MKHSSVLLVGAGGLGSPAAMYLAAAGVGRLGIVEFDSVETSNLHRQVLYGTQDVGQAKLTAAMARLHEVNPHVTVVPHPVRFSAANGLDLVRGYDVVVDGSDNFVTRYLVNDACVLSGTPNVYASVDRFEGQVSVFARPEGPCYRCLFEAPPPSELAPSCAEAGVFGVLPGLLGTLQATETLKLLLDLGEPLVGRLLIVDALAMQFRTLTAAKNPECAVCGEAPRIATLVNEPVTCLPTPIEPMASIPQMAPRELHELLNSSSPPFLLDVRQPAETEIASLGGALIPLGELPERLDELEDHKHDERLVVYCRSGARSAKAVQLLHENGYTNAVNLEGGILGWSDQVDPSVAKY